jgi:hypothetical protein
VALVDGFEPTELPLFGVPRPGHPIRTTALLDALGEITATSI